jgi:hypothetical protein
MLIRNKNNRHRIENIIKIVEKIIMKRKAIAVSKILRINHIK